MAAFGDKPATKVTTRDVSRFLRSLDGEEFDTAQRQQVPTGLAGDVHLCVSQRHVQPTEQPGGQHGQAARATSCCARLLRDRGSRSVGARVRARRSSRPTSAVEAAEQLARAAEDRQDADAFRVLFYTGIRVGELLTLSWSDVDLEMRSLLVRRNLSAGMETEPKGRRHRYVPLPDPAMAALAAAWARERFHWRRRLRGLQPLGPQIGRLGAPTPLSPRLRGGGSAARQASRASPRGREHPCADCQNRCSYVISSAIPSSVPPTATLARSTGPRTTSG